MYARGPGHTLVDLGADQAPQLVVGGGVDGVEPGGPQHGVKCGVVAQEPGLDVVRGVVVVHKVFEHGKRREVADPGRAVGSEWGRGATEAVG